MTPLIIPHSGGAAACASMMGEVIWGERGGGGGILMWEFEGEGNLMGGEIDGRTGVMGDLMGMGTFAWGI